ncbi:histidine kinase, partial [Kitasatospora sp. NPDC059571]|uniref:DUF7134 domain-containing protein n=1 Tax=Kitasatospora sp. NPDC059571 TaxID=3346871 RepID=UPI00369CE896
MTVATLPSQDPALPGLDGLGGHPLIGRLVRVGQRLHQVDTDHPWLLDTAVVAAAFVLFCIPDLVPDGSRGLRPRLARLPTAGVLVLQLALVVPLWWRRRAPSAAFAVVAAVVAVQWVAVLWLRADVALLVTLYAVALHAPLPHLPWACGATAAALGLIAVRLSPTVFFGDALFFLAGTATASVALGLVLRIRRAYVVALRERAVRLEIERDQRAELAAAAERARVAREMHDIVGHNLSVIIGLADGGAYAAGGAPARRRGGAAITRGPRRRRGRGRRGAGWGRRG